MGERDFFRKEATENLKHKQHGTVFINCAVPYTNLAIWISVITTSIIIFITTAEFSEKHTVNGYLNTDKGIANIYPNQSGIITKSFIQQGSDVKTGDILFIVNTAYTDISKDYGLEEYKLLQTRQRVINKEISTKQRQLQELKPLLLKKYIPSSTYQSKLDEINSLESTLHQIKLNILKLKKSLEYYIFSPINGQIANVNYKVGQYINQSQAIVNILPDDTILFAELHIPVAKAGFIRPNSNISIQYDAYPYQRYGIASASIQNIGKTVLTDKDENKPLKVGGPYYKTIAKLDSQFIKLSGKLAPLQQGMTCKATIYGHKKKIWQWIFDPIYNFYGNTMK